MVETVDCIVPAAGNSTRMGRWKPILPFAGTTIVETVIATALQVCSRVVLVTGYRGSELAARFEGEPRVVPVQNDAWQQGMFSSIRCGATRVRTRRYFVTLADMPWITEAAYRALLLHEETDVIFPAYAGMRGHPVLFNGKTKDAIAAADPESGNMRAVVSSFHVSELDWPDDSVLRDIDTEADLS
jgi:molybdenum cofactor cytidylyltransferase